MEMLLLIKRRGRKKTSAGIPPKLSDNVIGKRGPQPGITQEEYARRKQEKKDIQRAKKLDIRTTAVFAKLKEFEGTKVVCSRGGARSSKSHSLTQYFIERLFFPRKRNILVIRKTLPSLKLSVLPMFEKLLAEMGLKQYIVHEKQNMNYKYADNVLHFGSLDDAEKIKCLKKNTDVLTRDGWVNVRDLEIGMMAATMNPENRECVYSPIREMHKYKYKGELICPASETGDSDSHVGFAVTPEHDMLIGTHRVRKLRKVKAKDLPKVYYIPRTGKWMEGKIVKTFSIPKVEYTRGENNRKSTTFPIVPFLKFMGWVISEGCVFPVGGKQYGVSFTQKRPSEKLKLEQVLKDMPYNVCRYEAKEGVTVFTIYNKDMHTYLSPIKGSINKRIPREIMELHPSLLIHLYNSLMDGDAHRAATGRDVYTTISEGLKDDVMELAQKLGLSTCAKRRLPDNKSHFPNGKPYWNIGITDTKDTQIRATKKEFYDDFVYCPTVPPHNTICIRYNNKVMWCGQSSEWNDIWMEEATEFTIDDYRQLKLRMSAPDNGLRNQIHLSFNPVSDQLW